MPPAQSATAKPVLVKISSGMAGDYFHYSPGDIVDFSSDPEAADRLVLAGAEYADDGTKAKHKHYPAGQHPREIAAAERAREEAEKASKGKKGRKPSDEQE